MKEPENENKMENKQIVILTFILIECQLISCLRAHYQTVQYIELNYFKPNVEIRIRKKRNNNHFHTCVCV